MHKLFQWGIDSLPDKYINMYPKIDFFIIGYHTKTLSPKLKVGLVNTTEIAVKKSPSLVSVFLNYTSLNYS